MALNPLDKVYLDKTQLQNLSEAGTEASGNDTYTGQEDTIYLIDDDSIVITTTVPTTTTVGFVGQMRLIPTAGSEALYICTSTGSTYTWKQIPLS